MLKEKRVLLIGLICTAALLITVFSVTHLGTSVSVFAHVNQSPVVIIDPGHGGVDPGASGSGVVEKDVNLKISLALRDMLVMEGLKW